LPIYIYECTNGTCRKETLEEFRHTSSRDRQSTCALCGSICLRTYKGQTPKKRRRGLGRGPKMGEFKWEDIDDVPNEYNFTSEADGKLMDHSEIEIN